MPRCLIALALLVLTLSMPAAAQFGLQPSATPDASDAAEGAELDALIRILEDEAARERLIATLRSAADPAAVPPEPAPLNIAGRLAEYTRAAAEGAAGMIGAGAELVGHGIDIVTGVTDVDWRAFSEVVVVVAIVVAATFAAFVAARLGAARLARPMIAMAPDASLVRRAGTIFAVALLDAATVVVAWGVGHVVGLQIGQVGQLVISQTLFLNAFLLIELIKVGVRAVLAPRQPQLRPFRLDDTTAAYWYLWVSRLISVIGYTFLFVVPILAMTMSPAAAEAVAVLVLLTGLVMASAIVLQNREQVRRLLLRRAQGGRSDPLSRTLAGIAGIWHVIVIGYMLVVFVLWLADHEAALPFVLSATLRSLIAIAIGLALIALITRLASGGMRLPEDLKQRLPLLETRLNAFVPNILRVVRWAALIAVAIFIIQTWRLVDVGGWLTSDLGQQVISSLISAAIILLLAGLVYLAMSSWIEYRLNPNYGTVPTARERTLLALLRNAGTIVLAVLVTMLVLSELGVNIGPLLAGAGVVGLAVGFGAQKLVQDVITGVFIQFENAMNEGDVVTAGGITGVVEKLTIRSVSMRSLDGVYHVVPFSSVDAVSNFMKYFGFHVAEIGVAYRENIPDVKQAMQDAFDRLRETEHGDNILEDLEMHGVTQFADSAVVVRARIKTVSGEQWGVGRAYNEILKDIFDERGIEIPFPHRTLYMGVDHKGIAPPLRVEEVDGSKPGKSETAPAKSSQTTPRRTRRKRRDSRPAQDAPPGQESAPEDAT